VKAVEFTINLTGASILTIPDEIAAKLPRTGTARVIVLTSEAESGETQAWQTFAYQEFLHEDPPEDSAYDSLR
jgi:hypothetical protein